MIKWIKNYLEYRKNKKIIVNALANNTIAISMIGEAIESKKDWVDFILRLSKETKSLDGEQLVSMVIKEVSDKLSMDNARLVEILKYIFTMTPEQLNKLFVHAVVETMDIDNTNN